MDELPVIQESLRIKGNSIRVSGHIYMDTLGCYRVNFKYHSSSDWSWFGSGRKDVYGTHDLPLNGKGLGKAVRKIKKYIHSQI